MHPRPDMLNYDIALVDFICYPLTGGHISCFERRSVRGEENPHVYFDVASINYHLVCSHGSCHCPMSCGKQVLATNSTLLALDFIQKNGGAISVNEYNRHTQGSGAGRALGTLFVSMSTNTVNQDKWANLYAI